MRRTHVTYGSTYTYPLDRPLGEGAPFLPLFGRVEFKRYHRNTTKERTRERDIRGISSASPLFADSLFTRSSSLVAHLSRSHSSILSSSLASSVVLLSHSLSPPSFSHSAEAPRGSAVRTHACTHARTHAPDVDEHGYGGGSGSGSSGTAPSAVVSLRR